MDSSSREPYYRWLILATLLLLFLSIAREYPEWKAQRQKKSESDAQQDTTSSTTDTTTTPGDSPSSSPWPSNFSIRWIPYIPFAVVYLIFKALWAGLRLFILHSILFAEHAGVHLVTAVEKTVEWSVHEGPGFVRRWVIIPTLSVTITIWESPAIAKIKTTIENVVIPGIERISISLYESFKAAIIKSIAWMHTVIDPIKLMATWFAVECIYNPAHAIGSRLITLSHTFIQIAKIYLGELAKDAIDLSRLFKRLGVWFWNRVLTPLGVKAYALGSAAINVLAQFVLLVARAGYIRVIAPTGRAAISAFQILRSHPTLLAGLQALSLTVQEKCSLALQRVESVNWLILLETVLTAAFTNAYHYITLGLTVISNGLKYFAVEIVPNAYQDLMNALEVARPIVAWLIEKFIQVAHPLWQVISWVSWSIYTYIGPTLAWLHKSVILPLHTVWITSIFPTLTRIASVIVSNTTRIANMVLSSAPALAAVIVPAWNVLVQITFALQAVLNQTGVKIVELSGRLGDYIQSLAPHFETFKVQSGAVMDEVVLSTSNAMMDWVKKEKRD
ncbi:hypothetical protein FBU30_008282 [Linnemannia zychae]|nr:hypothetical protein FBU30_008282 [Linnemannia zychae]